MAKAKKERVLPTIVGSGITAEEAYQLKNDFYSPTGYPTKSLRQSYIGYCSRLLTDCGMNGATKEELKRATLFSCVVLDSIKFKLDILKAKDQFKITELEYKYMSKEDK
jgi:hypothetical protein